MSFYQSWYIIFSIQYYLPLLLSSILDILHAYLTFIHYIILFLADSEDSSVTNPKTEISNTYNVLISHILDILFFYS